MLGSLELGNFVRCYLVRKEQETVYLYLQPPLNFFTGMDWKGKGKILKWIET